MKITLSVIKADIGSISGHIAALREAAAIDASLRWLNVASGPLPRV